MVEFSVICVYNSQKILSNYLLNGLNNQSYTRFEKILIDNREGKYHSAASALNAGAHQANGEYFMFIHQDVALPPDYLLNAKMYLDRMDNLGVAGAAGVRETGKCSAEPINTIEHGDPPYSRDYAVNISEPVEVESLDELLLIIPRHVFEKEQFSTTICRGWHLYGVEYSMRMKENGKSVMNLPMNLWHKSDGGWRDWRHDIALFRLINSYPNVDCIHVAGGSWPATKRYVLYRFITNFVPIDLLPKFIASCKQDGLLDACIKVKNRLTTRFK